MRKFHIVTDSMCHIPSALCTELGIHVIPLPFVWDDITYLDDVDMGPRAFYSRLRTSETIPTTSAPTPGAFRDEFTRLSADGKPILAILVGKDFSSTFVTANLAKDMIPEVEITILDSELNTMALGFQVLAAARVANQGKEISEAIEAAQIAKSASGVLFAVQAVNYLRRGGRISLIEGLLPAAINIIPIMELKGGPIRPVERIRTRKNLIPRLLDLVSDRLQRTGPIRLAVVHSDAEALAWELMHEAQDHFRPDELIISELTPVLGIHTGPDALGLAYSSRI